MEIYVHDRTGAIARHLSLPRNEGITLLGAAEVPDSVDDSDCCDQEIVGGDLAGELMSAANTAVKHADSRLQGDSHAPRKLLQPKILLPVFNEDTLFVLRRKVALAIGVPFYRLFMWLEMGDRSNKSHRTVDFMYSIIMNTIIELPLRLTDLFIGNDGDNAESGRSADLLFGCPIDYALIKAEGRIRYDSVEFFRQVGAEIPAFVSASSGDQQSWSVHVCDFYDFYEPHAIDIINALKAQKSTWVRGFVNKFWPMITDDVLELIIGGREAEIEQTVPMLYNSPATLERQCRLIKELHAGAGLKGARAINDEFTMSITHAIVTMTNPQLRINLMSMFNSIATSNNIPLIHLVNSGNNQILEKTFPAADIFSIMAFLKTPAEFKDGIIVGLWIDVSAFMPVVSGKQMIYLNILADGQMSVYTNWREDYKITYESHMKIINRFVNPIIERLNEHYEQYTSSLLYHFTPDRARFKSLSVSIYWKKIASDADFRDFRDELKQYVSDGIFENNRFTNLQKDAVHLDFVKGGSHRDPYMISYRVSRDAFNYYSWLWLPHVHRIWMSLYGGIPIRIIHRGTDIRFELHNITPASLELFKHYMSAILFRSLGKTESRAGKTKITQKKLAKLNASDPVLYKFVKIDQHGDKKIYPVTCQQPKQPVIFSAQEFDQLSAAERKHLVKYWNYTYSEPAYYRCPSADYPHLGFQVDVHPNGFCLPCCQKLDPRTKPFYSKCMSHEDTDVTKDSRPNRHIFLYRDSPLDEGRLGHVPAIARYLANDRIHIFGVQQYLRGFGNIGLLKAIVLLLSTTVKAFVGKIMKIVKDVHVLQDLHEIFIKENVAHIFYRSNAEFNQLWLDMAEQIYDVNVLQINLQTHTARSAIGYIKNTIICLEKSGGIYEPVLEVDVKTYHLASETTKVPLAAAFGRRIFDIKQLKSIIIPALGASNIMYKQIPEKIALRICVHDTELGHCYRLDNSKGLVHLPFEYARNPLRSTTIDELHEKIETVAQIPFDRLRFDWLLQLIMDMKINIAYGIRAEGRVRILVDSKNRLYYTDATVAECESRGWPCDDDWHYDVNYVYQQVYTKFDMQVFMERSKQLVEFRQDMSAASNRELYNQLIYRNLTYVFILALSEFRNVDLREKIMQRIRDKVPFSDLALSPQDQQSLRQFIIMPNRRNIAKRNYEVVMRSLQLFKFEFDDAYLQWMRKQPAEELLSMIRSMTAKYVKFVATADSADDVRRHRPVMYHSLLAYEKHPLTVVGDERLYYEELSKHFVNPLYCNYFTTQSFGELFDDDLKNIDYTKLVLRPGERLDMTFLKLSEVDE